MNMCVCERESETKKRKRKGQGEWFHLIWYFDASLILSNENELSFTISFSDVINAFGRFSTQTITINLNSFCNNGSVFAPEAFQLNI